jgi:hypothetical protein
LKLGLLLEKQRDFDGAAVAYEAAVSSGHPEVAPHSGLHLGDLFRDGARTAYLGVVDAGDKKFASLAKGRLRKAIASRIADR